MNFRSKVSNIALCTRIFTALFFSCLLFLVGSWHKKQWESKVLSHSSYLFSLEMLVLGFGLGNLECWYLGQMLIMMLFSSVKKNQSIQYRVGVLIVLIFPFPNEYTNLIEK